MATDVFKAVVSEPSASTPEAYSRRVHTLAAIYFTTFVVSVAGMAILVWRGQFLVTLSQRSNVETLTLAFFFVFFGYMAFISRSGAVGALRLLWHETSGLLRKDWREVERMKAEAVGPAKIDALHVALNLRVHAESAPDEPLEVAVADEAGRVGRLEFDGARCLFHPDFDHTSNNVFVFMEAQLNDMMKERGGKEELDIIAWKSIDDEQTETFLGIVQFARNLERALGAEELWPKVLLSDKDIAELEQRMSRICRALRNECFLPDWEYSAEHKVPIIPEPLGLASISRSERRADPLSSMGLSAGVVVAAVLALVFLIAFPPWVPGK